MSYPQSYHDACNHLVAFDGHGGNTKAGRVKCARALWELRKRFGRERAAWERRHMLYITGQFPVKHRDTHQEGSK